eukprot:6948686-Heterocapsa_arctica.AAC.1
MYKTPRIVQVHKSNIQPIEANDMVLFKEGDTEEEAIGGLYTDLTEAKQKLTDLGQVLNDQKEHIFVQSKTGEIIWHQTSPDYKGRVGQA